MTRLACFKAYDIRGRIDEEVTESLAYRLGLAVVRVLSAKQVVIGRDARADSPRLAAALADGIQRAGAKVIDLGLCGTEEVYFGTDHFDACAGVMVTASHNPIDYNGFKLVGRHATPLSDATFRAIEAATAQPNGGTVTSFGAAEQTSCRDAYVERVMSFIEPAALKPMRILANSGNGAAGPTFDALVDGLHARGGAVDVVRLHHAPDPTFPNGIPNPLLAENQPVTGEAVLEHKAALGMAWDGDFDRCFFFDEAGGFIAGEYIVGLLAQAMLARFPDSAVVHDPRIMWNTQRVVREAGGRAVISKTGHALVKACMREVDAVYGGEMSAHHYFRDFMYCDSGMIPWVLVLAHLSQGDQSLGDVVAEMRARHPSSGELNFRVRDADASTRAVLTALQEEATSVDWKDGLSLAFDTWRLNLRSSNTEPLLRLNVETLGDADLLAEKTAQVSELVQSSGVAA